jgi:Xaa-Pro aminopeptidase
MSEAESANSAIAKTRLREAPSIRRGSEPINDPVFTRMSRAELERRWTATRALMGAANLDAIVALGFDDSLSGYVRWLCDFGAPAYMKVVLFHRNGPMSTIEHGGQNGSRDVSPDSEDWPGVGRILTASTFKSVASTYTEEARLAGAELGRRGVKKVGLLRPGAMPSDFVLGLKRALPGVEFSDQTDAMDQLKAVKSPAELDRLRDACRIQDEVFAKVLAAARPGVREVELLALAEYEFRLRGAIDGTMASGSAPAGQPAGIRPWRAQNRTLRVGDTFTILLEMSNDAGYYGELARQISIGPACRELSNAFQVVVEAQAAAVARMRPGAKCVELAAAHDEYMLARGHERETRLFSHSQGYDMVERPLVRADETMSLEAGMFLSCHPVVATPSVFAFLCDNYIVTDNGVPERVHATPQQIFEVDV